MNLKTIIDRFATPDIKDEIQHFLEVEGDEPTTVIQAYVQASEFLEEHGTSRKNTKAIRCIDVACGRARLISQEDYDNVTCTGDKRKLYPMLDGIHLDYTMTNSQIVSYWDNM